MPESIQPCIVCHSKMYIVFTKGFNTPSLQNRKLYLPILCSSEPLCEIHDGRHIGNSSANTVKCKHSLTRLTDRARGADYGNIFYGLSKFHISSFSHLPHKKSYRKIHLDA